MKKIIALSTVSFILLICPMQNASANPLRNITGTINRGNQDTRNFNSSVNNTNSTLNETMNLINGITGGGRKKDQQQMQLMQITPQENQNLSNQQLCNNGSDCRNRK